MLQQVVRDASQEIVKKDMAIRTRQLTKTVNKKLDDAGYPFSRKHFWFGTSQGLVSTLIFSGVLAILYFILKNGGIPAPINP